MCVLIYKPAGASVSENILRGCFERNDDGLGIGYSDGSTLNIWRTLTNIDEACKRVEMLADYPAMIHFRYATHGTVSMDNVHPFWINEQRRALVGHNGIIQIGQQHGESDTRSFVANVLAYMKDGWWNNHMTRTQIEKLLGGSRLAIMEEDGKCTFLNKSQGETTADGVWFSNAQFKQFVEPSAKTLPAASIMAGTGLAAPRQTGYHAPHHHGHGTAHGFDDWKGSRDPFQSKATTPPTPPALIGSASTPQTASGSTTTSTPSTTTRPPTPSTTTTPTASSPVSTTGGMVSAPPTKTSTPIILSGPLHDSEVKAWTEAFGIDWISDYVIGYVHMPNGVYGREEYLCEQHVSADIRNSLEPTVAALTAIDLIDAHFTGAKCHECHTLLTAVARIEYASFIAGLVDEEEEPLPPAPRSRSRRRNRRKESPRTTKRDTAASESGSLELVSVASDTPASSK